MSVVLMGYRASGKTTLGRVVAERLGLSFVDLDDAVRGRFGGATIADVWAEHGEPAFRAAESEAAAEWLGREGVVLALGGGTPMQPAAAESIRRSSAIKVYLHAPAEVLHARIHADAASPDQRPALTAAGGGLDEVAAVLAEREPVYRGLADAVIDTTEWSVERLVDRVASLAAERRARA